MIKNDKTIVIFGYYRYPCKEAVLKNVFAKELGRDRKIIWLFRSTKKDKSEYIKWYNSKVKLVWVYEGQSLFASLINHITFWFPLYEFLKILKRNNVSFVMVRDMPITTTLVSFIQRLYTFKLFYQYSAPLGKLDKAKFKTAKFSRKYFYFIRGFLLDFMVKKAVQSSDLVFPISEFHTKEISKYYDIKKMQPLTMGVDEDWLNNSLDHSVLEKIRIGGDKILNYSGTLNFTRDPLFILSIFKHVIKKIPNVKFIVMGEAETVSEQQTLETFCENSLIQDKVIFTGWIEPNELLSYLKISDLSICAIPPTEYFKNSSPTKLYESLGAGVPVVANKGIFEQEKVIKESGGGSIVDYNIKSFSDEIVRLLQNKEVRNEMAEKGKKYVIDNYSYKKISERISPLFF